MSEENRTYDDPVAQAYATGYSDGIAGAVEAVTDDQLDRIADAVKEGLEADAAEPINVDCVRRTTAVKASEVIANLAQLMHLHGDLSVFFYLDDEDFDLTPSNPLLEVEQSETDGGKHFVFDLHMPQEDDEDVVDGDTADDAEPNQEEIDAQTIERERQEAENEQKAEDDREVNFNLKPLTPDEAFKAYSTLSQELDEAEKARRLAEPDVQDPYYKDSNVGLTGATLPPYAQSDINAAEAYAQAGIDNYQSPREASAC